MIKNFIIAILCVTSVGIYAQNSTASPYSYFGVGDLRATGTVENQMMGGLSVYTDSIHINLNNPAAYSKLGLTTYTAGLSRKEYRFESNDSKGDLLAALDAQSPLDNEKLQYVNSVLADQASFLEIQQDAGGLKLSRQMLEKGPEALLAPIVTDFARLLTSSERTKIRQCVHDDCQLFFINNSRNGRRRWCSMSTCGNRSKVKAFLDRQA